MVKVSDNNGGEFSLDGWLVSALEIVKKALRSDSDLVILVDGREGSGKSHFAQQLAAFIDPTFSVDRMCTTSQEFIDKAVRCKPYQAIVYDEALEGLGSSDSLTKNTKHMVKFFGESRQLNLCAIICLPSFFDLNKNIALHRSTLLIHVYTEDIFQRGRFLFFNSEKKKNLYIKGKKFYNHNAEKANFFGRFVYHWCINEEEYKLKKRETLKRYMSQQTTQEIKAGMMDRTREAIIAALANYLKEHKRISYNQQRDIIRELTGMEIPKSTYTDQVRRFSSVSPSILSSDGYGGSLINNTVENSAQKKNKEGVQNNEEIFEEDEDDN